MTGHIERAPRGPHVQAAVFGGAIVAAAFEAAHCLAWSGRVNGWCVAFMGATVLVELEALTATFSFALARRRSPGRSFALSSAVGIGVGVVLAFAGWGVQSVLGLPVLGGMSGYTAPVVAQLGAFDGLVGLGLWATAVLVPFAVRDANARTAEAEQLRTAAELARLRANLQPHFLLNALSTVSGLMTEDPTAARNVVGALGDLLRDSLEDTGEMHTLAAELSWLRRYAEILETRHRGSLAFRWEVAEGTLGVRVPRLLLQPLLENAVTHGALRRRGGGEVSIRMQPSTTRADQVICVIEDNGPGPGARPARKGALGLELVMRRLALRYEGAAAFRLETEGGSTRSIVELPAEGAG